MKVRIIIGPPCAGKSTYVKGHADDGDVRVDFDRIATAFGSDTAHASNGSIRHVATIARTAVIEEIIQGNVFADSWIIQTNPPQALMKRYAEIGAEFILVDPGIDACLERARKDSRPEGTIEAIEAWYASPPEIPSGDNKSGASEVLKRAYSLLEVKSVSEEGEFYVVRGTATTPTPDRVQDVVEPLGATFAETIPLLWQHQSDKPVGLAQFEKPTKKGIKFVARLPIVKEAGALKDRIDEAIQSVRYRLVAAVSIGFRVIDDAVERIENGGFRFLKTEIMELSLVTIPAQMEATITSIKSLDTALRSASGQHQRGVALITSPASREPTRPAFRGAVKLIPRKRT